MALAFTGQKGSFFVVFTDGWDGERGADVPIGEKELDLGIVRGRGSRSAAPAETRAVRAPTSARKVK